MATAQGLIDAILERIRATARVDTIYGEPQTHHGRTVIPVARMAYGFGAGGGEGPTPDGQGTAGGGGGGGGVSVKPVGALIIDEASERFVAFSDWRGALGPAAAAVVLGYVIGRRRAGRRVSASPAQQ